VEPINPWEDTRGRFVDRLWTTVYGATVDPIGAFGRMGAHTGERDLRAAVRFALLVTTFGWLPVLLLTPCLVVIPISFAEAMPHDVRGWGLGVFCVAIGALPFLLVLGSLATELVHGLVFHAVSRVLGGKGDFRSSMHAMLYTSAIRFWLCPGLILGFVPFLGTAIQLAVRAGFVIWTGAACYGAARSLHRLDDSSAIIVGIFTPVLALVIVSFGVAAIVLAIAAATMGTTALLSLAESH
jgi:hypothetical protein